MFDEWAYTHVYEDLVPLSALNEGSNVTMEEQSLMKEVASLSLDPPPDIRRRAYSFRNDNFCDNKQESTPKNAYEWPQYLTSRTLKRSNWLQQANPDIFDFDEFAWQRQVRPLVNTKNKAELCAAHAQNLKVEADTFMSECSWLLSELRDVVENDLQPLSLALRSQQMVYDKKKLCKDIESHLQIGFLSLDRIERILKGPAPKVVPQLHEMVEQIDMGISLFENNPNFVGAVSILEQWQRARLKTIGIAGAYVQHELRKISAQLSSERNALMYTKFRSAAQRLRPIIDLVRQHGDEANTWLDLQRTYCDLRTPFVAPDSQKFAGILLPFTQFNDEYIDAMRTAIARTRQLCLNEAKLFDDVLGEPTPTFNTWLGDVALPLYAAVRKFLVHETDMGKLCQMAVLVNTQSIVRDDETLINRQNDTAVETPVKISEYTEPNITGDPVRDLLEPAAQSRLVFRAQIMIDKLSGYQPNNKDFLRSRFPTVETAVTLLSQVYELLPPHIFNELAHKCIREVLQSLDGAVANKMATESTPDVKIHLFHIKQLLILQSQISDFDLHNSMIHEVDFSGIQRLLQATATVTTRSFRELLSLAWDSIPRVVDIMVDAMEEVFASLRRAVERMCHVFTDSIFFRTQPLRAEIMTELRASINARFLDLRRHVQEYTADVDFSHFLLDSAQESVMDRYTREYRQLPQDVQRNENIMDIDTMSSWVSEAVRGEQI